MAGTTRVIRVEPRNPDRSTIVEAAAILQRGGLVAFPTETVYGLGADATNPAAVARIFEAKGRPAANPLIVHVDGIEMASRCVAPDALTQTVLYAWQRWWPGPVTLVHRKSSMIPEIVTAGGGTVGLRMPQSPVALALIGALGRPIAAPSANRSTGISPTQAEHVARDLNGLVDLILDGGPSDVGLESTVVDLTGECPRILRPGPVPRSGFVDGVRPNAPDLEHRGVARSPGQADVHYAPRTPAFRIEPEESSSPLPKGRGACLIVGHPEGSRLAQTRPALVLGSVEEATQRLYSSLHDLDRAGYDHLLIVMPPNEPIWEAIRDRLSRATTPLVSLPRG